MATPATIAIAARTPRVAKSTRTVASSGSLKASSAVSARVATSAMPRPSSAPRPHSSRLSVIACASSRPRPAPSATRTAISCRRLAARASCRLARLAQTISITTPTAASSSSIAVRRWPATCTASDCHQRPQRVALRVCGREGLAQNAQLGLRRLDRRLGLQASDDAERVAPAVGVVVERERREDIDRAARREQRAEVEGGGQHADDRGRQPVEDDRPPGHTRVAAVALLPQVMADQDHARAVRPRRLRVRRGEAASQGRRDAQHAEEVVGHRHAADPLGAARAGDPQVVRLGVGVVAGQVGEGAALRLQVAEVVGLDVPDAGAVVGAVADPRQASRVRQRQWPQHQGVHQAVDRRRAAEAEAHHQQRERREARVAPQRPDSQAQVADDDFDPRDAPLRAMRLAELRDAAEFELGGSQRRDGLQTGALQRFGPELDVQRELIVQVAIELRSREHRANARQQAMQGRQHRATPSRAEACVP